VTAVSCQRMTQQPYGLEVGRMDFMLVISLGASSMTLGTRTRNAPLLGLGIE